MAQLWGGRFEGEINELAWKFNASIYFDKRLIKQDVQGSKAHVTMLAKQGIITEGERDQIWNLGTGYLFDVMKANHIIQMNRMILYFQLNVSPSLFEMEAYKVQSVKPKYVLLWTRYPQNYNYISSLSDYTDRDGNPGMDADIQFVKDNYQRLSSTEWGDNGELVCYKRIAP